MSRSARYPVDGMDSCSPQVRSVGPILTSPGLGCQMAPQLEQAIYIPGTHPRIPSTPVKPSAKTASPKDWFPMTRLSSRAEVADWSRTTVSIYSSPRKSLSCFVPDIARTTETYRRRVLIHTTRPRYVSSVRGCYVSHSTSMLTHHLITSVLRSLGLERQVWVGELCTNPSVGAPGVDE